MEIVTVSNSTLQQDSDGKWQLMEVIAKPSQIIELDFFATFLGLDRLQKMCKRHFEFSKILTRVSPQHDWQTLLKISKDKDGIKGKWKELAEFSKKS